MLICLQSVPAILVPILLWFQKLSHPLIEIRPQTRRNRAMYNSTDSFNQVSTNGTQNGIKPTELQAADTDDNRSLSLALPESRDTETELPQRLAIVPQVANKQQDVLDDEQAELETQAKELLHQADAYMMQSEIELAIAHYRRALQFAPHLVDAHQGLAEALSQQGDLEEAAIHYQKAIDLLPLPIATTSTEETIFTAAPVPEPASEPTIDRLPWYEQAAFYLQQGKALCDRQQWQDTIAACEQAAKLLAPQTAMAFRLLGRALQAEKQLAAAEQSYSKSLAIEPELAETHARMGSVVVEQQRLTEAVDFFQQAIALDSKFTGAYLKLGEIWRQLGDLVQAADCLYRAYQLEPGWVTTKEHLQLGNLLMSQGRLEQASWCYHQVIELAPNHPNGYYNLAIALGKQHNWSEAVRYHQQAIERQPENLHLHAALGQALSRLNRWQEAIACYQRITELMPEYPQLQDALVQMERCQRALMAESYGKMAANCVSQQHWEAAINCYQQAIDRNPQNAEFQVGLAQAFIALMRWDDAVACYQKAIALEPTESNYRVALAEVLVKLGRFEEATQCYRQVVLNPTEVCATEASVVSEATTPANLDLAYTVL